MSKADKGIKNMYLKSTLLFRNTQYFIESQTLLRYKTHIAKST